MLRTSAGDLPADLLVAADGIRSALRPLLFPRHPGPSYAGYVAWRMVLPALPEWVDRLEPFETWGTGGRRFAVLPLSRDRWYCYATAAIPRGAAAGEAPREGLQSRFAGWHEPIPSILAAVPEQAVLRQDVEELAVPLPAMHDVTLGRTAVLGDAAHAMTPDLGQGGCMALEDAVELAACVSDSASDVAARLAEYTRRRLPRTSATALRSRRAGRLYTAPYPLQLSAARLMGLLPDALVARGLDGLLGWQPPR